jgi:hypothetical protein
MLLKRKALTLTLILSLLVSVLAGALLIQNAARTFTVQAETSNSGTISEGSPSGNITIQSPENKTYNENNVTLAFTIESGAQPVEYFNGTLFSLYLRHGEALDYDTSKLINLMWHTNLLDEFPFSPFLTLSNLGNNLYVGNSTLTNLSQGSHNITIWIRAEKNYLSYGVRVGYVLTTVSFNIDSTPPHVTILSPESKAYNTSDVPLDFTVNETASQITYSLDGQENITAAGNMTLTRLSNEAHNVTVYAADEAGNMGASETVTFTVAVPEPFPLVPVAVASVAVVAVVIAGLLLYFKKRKKESGNKS